MVVSRTRGPRTKMSANYVGPRRITKYLSVFVFRVEHLLTKETEDIHISRIKPYADPLVGSKVHMKEIAEFSERMWYAVNQIKDLPRKVGHLKCWCHGKDYQLQVIPGSQSK